MKKLFLIVLTISIFAYALYSTNTFKAFFLSDTFYQNICNATFNISQQGEEITLPLEYKYKAPHALFIAVPENHALQYLLKQDGRIRYEFISGDREIKSGQFTLTSKRNSVENTAYSAIIAMRFDLPLQESGENLKLRLKILEPVQKLEKYSGSIFCFVKPEEVYE